MSLTSSDGHSVFGMRKANPHGNQLEALARNRPLFLLIADVAKHLTRRTIWRLCGLSTGEGVPLEIFRHLRSIPFNSGRALLGLSIGGTR